MISGAFAVPVLVGIGTVVMATLGALESIRPMQLRQMVQASCLGSEFLLPFVKADFRCFHVTCRDLFDNPIIKHLMTQNANLRNRIIVRSHTVYLIFIDFNINLLLDTHS